jgi:hypothetical protein
MGEQWPELLIRYQLLSPPSQFLGSAELFQIGASEVTNNQ